MNTDPTVTATVLSLATALGGVTGYVRTTSVPSLVAGLTIGGLYGMGAYRLSNRQPYGVEMALVASLILAGSSIPRALRTGGKPLPVLLSALGTYGLVRFAREVRW
ncbi:MAG: hypothetical protein M1816_006441 [Peltula sp. TS41687]|nr:MAG: hypothetical protein M1816_006441 [Peltula sp. TS41687]